MEISEGKEFLEEGIQREEVFKMGSQGQGGLGRETELREGFRVGRGAISEEGRDPESGGVSGVEGAKRWGKPAQWGGAQGRSKDRGAGLRVSGLRGAGSGGRAGSEGRGFRGEAGSEGPVGRAPFLMSSRASCRFSMPNPLLGAVQVVHG